jgi:(p)ppGpp synthase/HD superfamily hydrolase
MSTAPLPIAAARLCWPVDLPLVAWTQPLYRREQIREAGSVLIADLRSPEDHEAALSITNNWRSAHGYPLNALQMNLRRIARKFDDDPIVAQRIKRLSSITGKLRRLDWLTLDEMQDLGGCRAVMSSVEAVEQVQDYCRDFSRMKHRLLQEDDYLARPKRSGYRGVHLIYAYAGESRSIYNGMKIELQLRSRLQHAWATSVETAGMFTAQALKSSSGDPD